MNFEIYLNNRIEYALYMKQYKELLKNNPIVRRLTLIQLISYFGTWFSNVAIYTLLVMMDVSATTIALVASLHFLPGVIQAPFTGVLIDRLAPKVLMLILLFVELLSTLLLLLVSDASMLSLLYVLIILRMGAASFYFTVEMSLLPRILDHESLENANTLHSMVWSFSYTFGMALSGLVVAFIGPYTAIVLDAMLFLLSFFLLLNLAFKPKMQKSGEHFFRQFVEGIVYLKNEPKVLSLLVLHAVVGFTAVDVLVVLLAKEHYVTLLSVPLAIGLIHAVRALALVVGPLSMAKNINMKTLFYVLVFQGCSFILWSFYIENFYYSLVLSFVVGFGITTLWAYTYTLIQIHTDEKYYGRVVSYNDMLFLAVGAFTAYFTGVLYDMGLNLARITQLLGLAFFIASIYYLWLKKRFFKQERVS